MRSPLPSLTSLLLALACGGTQGPATATPAERSECAGSLASVVAWDDPELGAAAPAAPVVAIRVRGALAVPESMVREAIALERGALLAEPTIRADIRRILELRVFDDVRVHTEHVDGGVAVTYEVVERPLIASARLIGEGGDSARHRVERLSGEVFQPGRLQRLSRKIASDRRREGYAEASVRVSARRSEEGVAVCLVVDAGRRWVVETFELAGNEALGDDALLEAMATLDGRVNAEGGVYRPDLLEDDLQRMQALYFDAGHVMARVGEPAARWEGDELHVTIPIDEGTVFRLREVRVTGELEGPASEYEAFLGLEEGATFDRSAIASALDRLRERERARGNISVYPSTEVDAEGRWVDLEVEVDDRDTPDPEPRSNDGDGEGPRLIDRELQPIDPSLAEAP